MNGNGAAWLLGAVAVCATGCGSPESRVVLYCAQDQEFDTGLLDEFHQRSGLAVAPKFDTEKDKAVSLYTENLHEKGRPRWAALS